MGGQVIRNAAGVQEALQAACNRRELLILATPYLRVDSHFVRLEGNELHVAATMTRDDAMYGLKSNDLHMRFPHHTAFLEGKTELKGFGIAEGRRTLRLAIPATLQDDELRGAYRVDRVGKVTCTYSTRKYDLQTASLTNISTTGARLHAFRDFTEEELRMGDSMSVTIPLLETVRINSPAKVKHIHTRSFGVEFEPPLGGTLLENLSRWIFQKREEDREREARRGVETAAPGEAQRSLANQVTPKRGIVVLSGDAELEGQLREVLEAIQPVSRVPSPGGQGIKEALTLNPALLIVHVASLSLDERRRLKTLLENLSTKVPFILLGTSVDPSALMELGTEVKAACVYQFSAQRGAFFQRLVQGILRRHGAEAGPAPEEG
ncbi:MAG TPA: PilZ domain-containing protein [Holophagaceae bacterium]|nr:PilZ domain-containing protein [Holophagaceae bacterium]